MFFLLLLISKLKTDYYSNDDNQMWYLKKNGEWEGPFLRLVSSPCFDFSPFCIKIGKEKAALYRTVKHSFVFDRYSFISSIHSTIYLKASKFVLFCFGVRVIITKVPAFTENGVDCFLPFIKAQIFLSLLTMHSKTKKKKLMKFGFNFGFLGKVVR